MSEPKSFKPLGFNKEDLQKINPVKPFVMKPTSRHIPLDNLFNNNEEITLIDFANIHGIPMDDINILLKNGISTVDKLSTVGIAYLKTLELNSLSAILSALSK